MSEKNIVYLEVCYGKTNSICIRATKKLKKRNKLFLLCLHTQIAQPACVFTLIAG